MSAVKALMTGTEAGPAGSFTSPVPTGRDTGSSLPAPAGCLTAGAQDTAIIDLFLRNPGVEATCEELEELKIFYNFLVRHVKAAPAADAQRMTLWAEWVRFYSRYTRTYPHLILEKEFTGLMASWFNTSVTTDDRRGQILPGVRFIP